MSLDREFSWRFPFEARCNHFFRSPGLRIDWNKADDISENHDGGYSRMSDESKWGGRTDHAKKQETLYSSDILILIFLDAAGKNSESMARGGIMINDLFFNKRSFNFQSLRSSVMMVVAFPNFFADEERWRNDSCLPCSAA